MRAVRMHPFLYKRESGKARECSGRREMATTPSNQRASISRATMSDPVSRSSRPFKPRAVKPAVSAGRLALVRGYRSSAI